MSLQFFGRLLPRRCAALSGKVFGRHRTISTAIVCCRRANPDHMDSEQFLNTLCSNLQTSDSDGYGYLSSRTAPEISVEYAKQSLQSADENSKLLEELVEACATSPDESVHAKCLELFNDWAGKAKLAVGYLLYLNRGAQSDEFITRLVKHLSADLEMIRQDDFVALLLMIYLRRKWDPEELYEYLDPTLLQKQFGYMLTAKTLSNAEICAICLGLKKISGFTANHPDLRDALYNTLRRLSTCVGDDGSYIDNMTVINICTLLTQQRYLYNDSDEILVSAMKAYVPVARKLNIRTAVKIMCLGMTKNLVNHDLMNIVLERIREGDVRHLSLREIIGLANFLTRVEMEDYSIFNLLLNEAVSVRDEDCCINDVLDIIKCFHFSSFPGLMDLKYLAKLFDAANAVPESVFSSADISIDSVSKELARTIFSRLFPVSFRSADFEEEWSATVSAESRFSLVNNLAGLDQTLIIDHIGQEASHLPRLQREKCHAMLKLTQKPVPMEAFVPSMALRNLSLRQRTMIRCYRDLNTAFKVEGHVFIGHILPHLKDPDIVFGHLGGNVLSVPSYMTEWPSTRIKPAQEVGDWFVVAFTQKHGTGKGADMLKKRLLKKLGYNIVEITVDQKGGKTKRKKRDQEEFQVENTVVEEILSKTIFVM